VSARPQLAQSKADASNKNRILNNNAQRDREKTLLLMRRSFCFRGAQAASLQPSAACRRDFVLGKLPSTAG
jgi:hypothetical protein